MREITLALDLQNTQGGYSTGKQGDDTTLTLLLLCRGNAYIIPDGAALSLVAVLPDETNTAFVQYDGITRISPNAARIRLARDITDNTGVVHFSLNITGGNPHGGGEGFLLSTFLFSVTLAPALVSDGTVDPFYRNGMIEALRIASEGFGAAAAEVAAAVSAAVEAAENAENAAASAEGYKNAAETAKALAETAAGLAQAAANVAEIAKQAASDKALNAALSAEAAQNSRIAAQTSAQDAGNAREGAVLSAENARIAADDAAAAQALADISETAALAAQAAAELAQTASEKSALLAGGSASDAEGFASAAEAAKTAAEAAAAAANSSRILAESAKDVATNMSAAAVNAALDAINAKNAASASAQNAADSETAAENAREGAESAAQEARDTVEGKADWRDTSPALITDTGIAQSHTITDISPTWQGLRGLTIFGDTVQEGIPTPEAPVPLVGVTDPAITVDATSAALTGTTLNGIGSVKDTVDVTDDNAILTQRMQKRILTGTENWQLQGTNTNGIISFTLIFAYVSAPATTAPPSLASHLPYVGVGLAAATTRGHFIQKTTSSETLYVRLYESDIPDLAAYKAWLAAQYSGGTPLTVVYMATTPTVTDITGTPGGQALLALRGTYPETEVTCDTDCEVTYNQDINKAFQNLTNAVLAIGGNI